MAVTEILLLRHAEKPGATDGRHGFTPEGREDGKSLAIRGRQRAGALAALLAPNPPLGPRPPSPDRARPARTGSTPPASTRAAATAVGRSRRCCRSCGGWACPSI